MISFSSKHDVTLLHGDKQWAVIEWTNILETKPEPNESESFFKLEHVTLFLKKLLVALISI